MALWPFRRKTVRNGARTAPLDDNPPTLTRTHTNRPDRTASRTVSRTASRNSRNSRTSTPVPRGSVRKKQRPEPNKLQRRTRTYSFSPNRRETIRVDARGRPQGPAAAVRGDDGSAWSRTPTLYLRRGDQSTTRRKSSKRRHDDHEREAEIKAMSAHMPKPPADVTDKHSTKRTRTNQTQGRKRTSELSLPMPDSMPSSISGDSDMTSYKVSIFDSLAPRPTLRYAAGIKRTPSRASGHSHAMSPRGTFPDENVINEEEFQPRRRIDDLADDLDAKALRELMDRDSKRRQRDRTKEQKKTKAKIADTAQRHQKEAEEAKKSGSPSPSNMERGVMGRELAGLGIDPASAVVTSSRHRVSKSPEPSTKDSQTPLQAFHRTDTLPSEDAEPQPELPPAQQPEREEPAPSRLSGLLKSKKSRSKLTLESEKDKLTIPEDGDSMRKGSDTSAKPTRMSLSSLLKWNSSKNKRSSGPSSFSNTSREEMQAAASAHAQAEALARLQGDDVRNGSTDNLRSGSSLSGNYVASKAGGAMPKRTRSRFREDLDDFPTPPDSRVQSPEAEPPMPNIANSEHKTQPIPIPRHGTPATFGQRSNERLRDSRLTEGAASPDPHLSMSLASIDSEGSWLSGGPGNRRSATVRDSLLRASRKAQPSGSPVRSFDEELEMGITEDDYMTRLAPSHQSPSAFHTRRSEEGRPSSDEESDMKWGAVGARPRFVHRLNRGTVHSQQALVNVDSTDDESFVETTSR